MIYSIEVGRWTGPFFFVWYADIFSSESHRRVASFNSLTKSGARNAALRYVKRLHRHGGEMSRDVTVYSYDAAADQLQQLLPTGGSATTQV